MKEEEEEKPCWALQQQENPSLPSGCLICNSPNAVPFLDKDPALRQWALQCRTSLSCIFQIRQEENDPVFKTLSGGQLCLSCLQSMRDLDFALRSLVGLLLRLERIQKDVIAKVKLGSTDVPEGSEAESSPHRLLKSKLLSEESKLPTVTSEFMNELLLSLLNVKVGVEPEDEDMGQEVEDEFIIDPDDGGAGDLEHGENEKFEETAPNTNAYVNEGTRRLRDRKSIRPPSYLKEEAGGSSDSEEEERDMEWKEEFIGFDPDSYSDKEISEGEEIKEDDDRPAPKKRKRKRTKNGPPSRVTIPCDVSGCKLRLYSEVYLAAHKRKVHEGDPTPYHCDQCPRKFSTRKNFNKHVRDKDKYCNQEGKEPTNKPPRRCPKPNTVFCDVCNRGFSSLSTLQQHVSRVHERSCSFCGLEFPTEDDRKTHEDVHKGKESPFTCTICDSVFSNHVWLQKHMKEKHSEAVSCNICGVKFRSAASYRLHQAKHDDSLAKFKCDVCGLVCLAKSTLDQHMLKHSDTKSFICETCGKAFSYPASLKRHQLNHIDRNLLPCECKICGKRFAARQFLKNHEEFHATEPTLPCKYCGKLFKATSGVGQHERNYCSKRPNKKPKQIENAVSSDENSVSA